MIRSSKARFVLLLKKKSAVYKDNVKNTDCIDSVTILLIISVHVINMNFVITFL